MTDYSALFLFAGLGGGALGFTGARAEFKGAQGRFRVCGAVDFDAAAARDFELLVGAPCHVADIARMEPWDLRSVCSGPPDVVFTSPPCKSFSACLPSQTAATPKYVDMADLAVRGLFLAMEAWPERRPRLVLLENVPRIQVRGRHLLDVILGMLRSYGYAVRETVHDCGELGGLAQRRRRFLLVARHTESTGDWWRQPPRRRVRGVGEVLWELPVPLPGSTEGGPMHRLPRLSALNWLRLALIPAGGDWRDLPESVRLAPRSGRLNGGFGVESWGEASHAVVAEGSVRNTWASVADPRLSHEPRKGTDGVEPWTEPAGTVLGHATPHKGFTVADPRLGCEPRNGVLGVAGWPSPSDTVIGHLDTQAGRAAVADPRVTCERNEGSMGVRGWAQPSAALIGHASIQNWPAAVADPRALGLDVGHVVQTPDGPVVVGVDLDLSDARPMDRPPILIAVDGTWHRPMTTLELAALQSLPTRTAEGAWLELDGRATGAWRERIGNAVPVATAEAIATSALSCLLSSDAGAVTLGCEPVWVGPQREGLNA